MLKTYTATSIAALYPRHNHIQDFHVLAHLNRVHAFAWGDRRCGKTYAASQQELIRTAFQLSTGATLQLLHARRKQPLMDRMVGYDPASGAGKSVECVFWRDPDTGALTLLSAENGPRKWRNSPWFYFNEWPWA
ncbi:hypothetical protein JEM67_10395 [Serratia sp. PAMC26656]|uniref:hypothetical protein n=1 Tax=Serratia sp. PAMC26656 TaxID=2775909 RepID=UPI0018F63E21|nr:hypothetical protein [Serratia sp. PAMC26656]MBJ7892384.1 hypothetical protein [Serratia sp. PAMC26656]